MASSNIPTLEELEVRLRKLQERDKVPSLEELEVRLAKLQDRPHISSKKSIDEVDNIIEQMQSELKLEHKSKELNNKRDQELHDRLRKLREDRSEKQTSLSFDKTKLIVTDGINAQAEIVSRIARQTKKVEEKKSLVDLAINLSEVSNITSDISPSLKEHKNKVLDIIADSLNRIYEGIKKITVPAVNTLKKIGSVFIDSIKSLSKKSSDKQMEETKEKLKELYKTYADLKGVDGKVKEKFLKNHYDQINQLQTPEQIFLETAKITQSIAIAGRQKVQEQQQAINRTGLSPSNTPNNTTKTSKTRQR